MAVDPAEVARLLQASRGAHAQYRQAANTPPPNYVKAEQHVASALDLRLQAHALDPQHTAPAWADDRVKHDELCEFYRRYAELP